MDRFAFLRALAPQAGSSGDVETPIFEGACCFLDDCRRVLYFLPSPQNDDSTQLSCTLVVPEAESCTVMAEFDASYRLKLRRGMVSNVNVVEARTNRPPALCVTLQPVAVTIQLWCGSQTCSATALENMATLSKTFADLIMAVPVPRCLEGIHEGGENQALAGGVSGSCRDSKSKRPVVEGGRADAEPPLKRHRVSLNDQSADGTVDGDGKGAHERADAMDVLTSSCDKLNGMCCRALRSQRHVVDLCLGIKTIVHCLLQHHASGGDAASQAGDHSGEICRNGVPTAQVDAHLTTLAKTVAALHHHGFEARNNLESAQLALQRADRLLLLKTAHPGAAGASGCSSSSYVVGTCSRGSAAQEEAKAYRGGESGAWGCARDSERGCAGSADASYAQQAAGDADDVLRVSRSIQAARVDLAMLACWGA